MGSIVDNTADADRKVQALTQSFQKVSIAKSEYDIALSNVSAIRPPSF
jgi:hypothetical protein